MARTDEEKDIAKDAKLFKRDLGHFYLLLFGVAVIAMLLAPVLNRYLDAWQAVVVAPPENGKVTLLMYTSLVVKRSVPGELASKLAVGDYLLKKRMSWNPMKIREDQLTDMPTIEDPLKQPPRALPSYFERYMSSWAGTVVSVTVTRLPTNGDAFSHQRSVRLTMQLAVDGRGVVHRPVPDAIAKQVRAGTRLVKKPRTWRPTVVGQNAPIPKAGMADGGMADGGAADGGTPHAGAGAASPHGAAAAHDAGTPR